MSKRGYLILLGIGMLLIPVVTVLIIQSTMPPATATNTATNKGPEEVVIDESGYTMTKSGLKYYDEKIGDGEVARPGQRAEVHYTGWLTNGTKFDSSHDRNKPFDFTIGSGQVIKGWDEGVVGMKIGGKRKLIVPPALGYADRPQGSIPANSTPRFDVELLKLN